MLLLDCLHTISTSYGLPISLFLAGLVGGMTHCVGMCSPFVLAQTTTSKTSESVLKRITGGMLLPYHLGRITTYVVLAILVNAVINLAFVYSETKILISVPLLMTASVIFLISAFPQISALFPWAKNVKAPAPVKTIMRFSRGLMNNPGIFKRYALGVLLGFLPCGLVISALMASATAQTSVMAGLSMAAFAIGTMPSLIAVSLGGQALRVSYPALTTKLARGAMVVSSIWLVALAGMMVF